MLFRSIHPTPLGGLVAVASDSGLRALLWPGHPAGLVRLDPEPVPAATGEHPVLSATVAWLDAYFDDPASPKPLPPLDVVGTPFQRKVWDALAEIGPGETMTYGALAASIGEPTGARAVGASVGRNPVSILVPCHRVMGASGALTGFAGGLDAKRWLLDHEAGVRTLV